MPCFFGWAALGMSVAIRAFLLKCDRKSRETRKHVHTSQERQRAPSNSSGRPRTARFGADPDFAISADLAPWSPNGRVRGRGRRRRDTTSWAKPRRMRVYA